MEEAKSPNGTSKHTRTGTMSKDFRFPPQTPGKDSPPPPPVPDLPSVPRGSSTSERVPSKHASSDTEEVSLTPLPVIPSSVEVPPPPPVDKDKERSPVGADDEDVGETEEISLN